MQTRNELLDGKKITSLPDFVAPLKNRHNGSTNPVIKNSHLICFGVFINSFLRLIQLKYQRYDAF